MLISVTVIATVLTPWVARNYARTGAFVLTRSHVGFGFWLGNNPMATGGEGDPTDPSGARSIFERASPDLQQRVRTQPDEISQDRVFRDEAIRYVADHPLAFIGRVAKKLVYFWWFPPYAGKRYHHLDFSVYQVFYALVLALAVGGVALCWRRPSTDSGMASWWRFLC